MAVDNATESSAVINLGFPFIMVSVTEGSFGPEESAGMCGTYGEAAAPAASEGVAVEKMGMSIGINFGGSK